MKPLTVGRVAKEAGIGIETIRFYEREGLLEQPRRDESSGYRHFEPEVIVRLRFIMRAKELGFTLPEIRDLLHLRVDAKTTCEDVRQRAEAKVSDITRRIDDLTRIKAALEAITAVCAVTVPGGPCPILEALDRDGQLQNHNQRRFK